MSKILVLLDDSSFPVSYRKPKTDNPAAEAIGWANELIDEMAKDYEDSYSEPFERPVASASDKKDFVSAGDWVYIAIISEDPSHVISDGSINHA